MSKHLKLCLADALHNFKSLEIWTKHLAIKVSFKLFFQTIFYWNAINNGNVFRLIIKEGRGVVTID